MPVVRITEYKNKTGLDKHSPRLRTIVLELEFTGDENELRKGGFSFGHRANNWLMGFEKSLASALREYGISQKNCLFHEEEL